MKNSAALVSISLVLFAGTADPSNAASSDACALVPAFSDEFDTVDVAAHTIRGKKWIAHTPWNGDFGDAAFSDPSPGFPFKAEDGKLTITARRDAQGKWQSGLLASADASGAGFSLQYGYFETRAKLPKGPGVWPAFWLGSVARPGWTEPTVEIDVIEYYGHSPAAYQSSLHIWSKVAPTHRGSSHKTDVEPDSLTDSFNLFGVKVSPLTITYYLNRKPVWEIQTPAEHKLPLIILANLALGSGFPIVNTPNPSVMELDYIRAYSFGPDSHSGDCRIGEQTFLPTPG